jgi:hypothetical protein
MKRLAAAAALLFVVVAGVPARSAPFTTYFDGLRAELVLRKDNQFEKLQQKAILKSLAIIDRPAKDFTDDLHRAAAVIKALEKGFPADFPAPLVFAPTPLYLFVDGDLLMNLDNDVHLHLDGLSGNIPLLVPGTSAVAKCQKAADAATAILAVPVTSRDAFVKELLKAWKKILAGEKAFSKGTSEQMNSDASGVSLPANSMRCDTYSGDGGLVLFGLTGSASFPGTVVSGPVAIEIKVLGVTGTGTYPIGADPSDRARIGAYVSSAFFAPYIWDLTPGTGTLVVTHFDPAGHQVAGHFAFSSAGGPGSGGFPATLDVSGDFIATADATVNAGTTP